MKKVLYIIKNIPKNLALGLILFYKKCISPLTPPSCRFLPTCSEYAVEAFEKYGFVKGFLLTVKRVGRCHPWSPGGYDPVP